MASIEASSALGAMLSREHIGLKRAILNLGRPNGCYRNYYGFLSDSGGRILSLPLPNCVSRTVVTSSDPLVLEMEDSRVLNGYRTIRARGLDVEGVLQLAIELREAAKGNPEGEPLLLQQWWAQIVERAACGLTLLRQDATWRSEMDASKSSVTGTPACERLFTENPYALGFATPNKVNFLDACALLIEMEQNCIFGNNSNRPKSSEDVVRCGRVLSNMNHPSVLQLRRSLQLKDGQTGQ